ncbi:MAG: ferritin family protein [Candidatus Aminicenantaceae bacterium]
MTQDNRVLDIIKNAILLEHKGKALYDSVVKTTEVVAVKDLFSWLAEEEVTHIAFLGRQFRRLSRGEDLDASGIEEGHKQVVDSVLTLEIVQGVSGAGYEAAVISAALEFEKRAVAYYSEQAEKAETEAEKEIFGWLSKWEVTHMEMLAKVDDELKQDIWYDNQFWPLD